MKGGLDQATLREPRVSIVGEQAIAQHHPEYLIGKPSLALVLVTLLHHMAYPIGMKDQSPGTHNRRQCDDIAVALTQVLQKREGMTCESDGIAERGIPGRSGWLPEPLRLR